MGISYVRICLVDMANLELAKQCLCHTHTIWRD